MDIAPWMAAEVAAVRASLLLDHVRQIGGSESRAHPTGGDVQALRAIGVECIVAPYEADCQMAYLALNGFVHALVTEDSDLLVYGCPRVRALCANIFHAFSERPACEERVRDVKRFAFPRSRVHGLRTQVLFKMDHAGMGFEIRSKDLPLTREILLSDFTADQFLEMCIMSGCDYLPSVSGVGVKKAHSYISRFKTHSKVRASVTKDRSPISVRRMRAAVDP